MKLKKRCPICLGDNIKVYRKGDCYKVVCQDCERQEAEIKKRLRAITKALVKADRLIGDGDI